MRSDVLRAYLGKGLPELFLRTRSNWPGYSPDLNADETVAGRLGAYQEVTATPVPGRAWARSAVSRLAMKWVRQLAGQLAPGETPLAMTVLQARCRRTASARLPVPTLAEPYEPSTIRTLEGQFRTRRTIARHPHSIPSYHHAALRH